MYTYLILRANIVHYDIYIATKKYQHSSYFCGDIPGSVKDIFIVGVCRSVLVTVVLIKEEKKNKHKKIVYMYIINYVLTITDN